MWNECSAINIQIVLIHFKVTIRTESDACVAYFSVHFTFRSKSYTTTFESKLKLDSVCLQNKCLNENWKPHYSRLAVRNLKRIMWFLKFSRIRIKIYVFTRLEKKRTDRSRSIPIGAYNSIQLLFVDLWIWPHNHCF